MSQDTAYHTPPMTRETVIKAMRQDPLLPGWWCQLLGPFIGDLEIIFGPVMEEPLTLENTLRARLLVLNHLVSDPEYPVQACLVPGTGGSVLDVVEQLHDAVAFYHQFLDHIPRMLKINGMSANSYLLNWPHAKDPFRDAIAAGKGTIAYAVLVQPSMVVLGQLGVLPRRVR